MKTGYIFDSNILIPYLLRNFELRKLRDYLLKGVYLNELVLTETLNYIQNRYPSSYSILCQQQVEDNQNIFQILEISPEIRSRGWQIRQKYADNKLAYTDAIILAQAQFYSLTILTQDQAMLSSGIANGFNPLI